MKDYNTKIEELNKEIKESENQGMCNRDNFDRGKIEQLNSDRTEAIEEVKELQKEIIEFQMGENIEYDEVTKCEGVIDYLKQKWNLTDEEVK